MCTIATASYQSSYWSRFYALMMRLMYLIRVRDSTAKTSQSTTLPKILGPLNSEATGTITHNKLINTLLYNYEPH